MVWLSFLLKKAFLLKSCISSDIIEIKSSTNKFRKLNTCIFPFYFLTSISTMSMDTKNDNICQLSRIGYFGSCFSSHILSYSLKKSSGFQFFYPVCYNYKFVLWKVGLPFKASIYVYGIFISLLLNFLLNIGKAEFLRSRILCLNILRNLTSKISKNSVFLLFCCFSCFDQQIILCMKLFLGTFFGFFVQGFIQIFIQCFHKNQTKQTLLCKKQNYFTVDWTCTQSMLKVCRLKQRSNYSFDHNDTKLMKRIILKLCSRIFDSENSDIFYQL